jgi:hypothetical protein
MFEGKTQIGQEIIFGSKQSPYQFLCSTSTSSEYLITRRDVAVYELKLWHISDDEDQNLIFKLVKKVKVPKHSPLIYLVIHYWPEMIDFYQVLVDENPLFFEEGEIVVKAGKDIFIVASKKQQKQWILWNKIFHCSVGLLPTPSWQDPKIWSGTWYLEKTKRRMVRFGSRT